MVEAPRFDAVVQRLASTRYPVPAPLNQLAGRLACGFRGHVDLTRKDVALPFVCRSDLRSASQSLVAGVDLGVRVRSVKGLYQPVVAGSVVLEDVRLVLPEIKLDEPIPRVVKDSRIEIPSPDHKSRLLPLEYRVAIRTKTPGAVHIANSITSDPVPMSLDLVAASGRGLDGTVDLGGFGLALFRRQAKVERIGLRYTPGHDAAQLDGRVTFKNNDYRIYLSLLGTTQQPKFNLYPEPPLPERDAVAVLLFGRKPELLDEDAQRSSEEARAAMADSAISLISMYYLASTPIESIGYNPHTGVFTAKVKLHEGLSLTLGSDVDATSTVGLRKTIGRNWSVETTAVSDANGSDDSSSGNKGVAMLKWGKRY
jgi:hypothetical protein